MRAELLIPLDANGPLSLQDQVRRGVIRAVAAGDLPRGAKAPSSRSLAAKLGVSRNTVLLAYQQLIAEGFLVGRERSGLYVASDLAPVGGGLGEVAGVRGEAVTAPLLSRLKSGLREPAPRRTPPDWARYPYPFIDGLIDPSLFPAADWREASRRALAARDVATWASGQGDADDPMLIDEIRTKILPRRGIYARPDEVMITLGSQQAASIALKLFVDRRSTVALEDPGYADLRDMARDLEARLRRQPVDAAGMVVDERLADADVIVVTPSHHYPTGVTLSLDRREALLALAARTDAVIVEDDFECEASYFEPALPALRALPGGERVVYAASLSAVLGPALRLGFMVADARVIAEARRLRRLSIKHPPLASQRTAAYFLGQGFYDKTMARTGRVFRRRRLALRDALNHYLQRWVAIDPSAGGTSCWVRGPDGIDIGALALEAERRGVLIEPVDSHYEADAPPNVFRLGVTGVPVERIRAGIEVLAGLIREKISPSFDTASLAPVLASGERLRAAMAGATLLCKTVYGAPCTIELLADGAMLGRAGYANEDRDEGRWWVEGDIWFRQWNSWAYGEPSGYRPLIEDGRVQWLNAMGVAVDSAVYVAPGADRETLAELAP
ncbi:MAG: PLP-dependent aminotransferase family protein [Caulobacteraceae bacterium]|nr:PLP-dependent aminotransferase family protein [Caulobacteraceae bacterium]